MKEVTYTNGIPICPVCDKPTPRGDTGFSTSTCMGFSRSYDKNGKDISINPNISTHSYNCHECGNQFTVKTQFGKSEYVDHLKQTYS